MVFLLNKPEKVNLFDVNADGNGVHNVDFGDKMKFFP